jgi:sugar-phosphatase
MVVTASALLFDLDGVLVDSTPAIERVWTRWAIKHGFEPEKTVREAHGRPSLESVRDLLPDADHEALNRELEQGEIEDLEGVVPLPGAVELLTSLPPDRWTIVTSCGRELAEVRLRAAGLPQPPTMVTFSEITRGKPDPEPYLKGAAKLGFSPADCIILEDVPAGILSGKAAGSRVIVVRTTATEEEFALAKPDWVVDSCASVSAQFDDSLGVLRLTLR